MYDKYFDYQQRYGRNQYFDGFRNWYENNSDFVAAAPDTTSVWNEYMKYRKSFNADGTPINPTVDANWKAANDANLVTIQQMRQRFNGGGQTQSPSNADSAWNGFQKNLKGKLGL